MEYHCDKDKQGSIIIKTLAQVYIQFFRISFKITRPNIMSLRSRSRERILNLTNEKPGHEHLADRISIVGREGRVPEREIRHGASIWQGVHRLGTSI